MKKLLLIITVLLSINCFSQDKFEKEFILADSVFNSIIKDAELRSYSDSLKYKVPDQILFDALWSVIESDTTRYKTSVNQTMKVYFSGYINGIINSEDNNGEHDMYKLLSDIVNEKRALQSWIRYKNSLKL
jgi:hypothetical protein